MTSAFEHFKNKELFVFYYKVILKYLITFYEVEEGCL